MFFFLFLLFLLSCGIKAPPKPLPEPQFQVKRIGSYVYVIGEAIEVKGFEKSGNFWYKKNKNSFCFNVRHIKGKSKKVCVSEANFEKPKVLIKEFQRNIVIIPVEKGIFRVYRIIKDDLVNPTALKEFQKEIKIPKEYKEFYIGITKVVGRGYESSPKVVKILPKPYPVPESPYSGGYILSKGKIVIYWFHKDYENLKGFNIYKNGIKLNKNPTKKTTFTDRIPNEKTIYKITAVNSFGMESKPLEITVYLQESRKF